MQRKHRIETALQSQLNPIHLQVDNESNQHHVPKDSETHFKLTIVSEQFCKLSKIARHKLIYQLLATELQTGLHALTMHLYTPEEWQKQEAKAPASPACRDGFQRG